MNLFVFQADKCADTCMAQTAGIVGVADGLDDGLEQTRLEVVEVAVTCKPTKSTTDRTWLLQFRHNRYVSGPAATE